MKKLNFFISIALFSIFITGCEKQSYENISVKNRSNYSGIIQGISSDATRKLIEVIVIDHDTKTQTVTYDCSQPGGTCDVGEKAKGPDIKNGLIMYPNTPIKNWIYNYEEEFTEDFPIIFDSEIKAGVLNGILDLKHDDGFLLLTQNNKSLYAYDLESQINDPEPVYEWRVLKVNTQTQMAECIDPGDNCRVRVSGDKPKRLIENIRIAFPDIDLVELVNEGIYTISLLNNDIYHFKPSAGSGYIDLYLAN